MSKSHEEVLKLKAQVQQSVIGQSHVVDCFNIGIINQWKCFT